MEKINETNYLDYFKKGIDWENVLTMFKVIAMTRNADKEEVLSIEVEKDGKKYTIEKSDDTICIVCKDGRKMIVKYDINGNHADYQRASYRAADASVTIEINDHSNVVFGSTFEWIDRRYKTVYLGERDIDEFNAVYAIMISRLCGQTVSYDCINDTVIRSANGETFDITADTERKLSFEHPLTSTVQEAKEFRDNLTNEEAAHNYVGSKVFSKKELDYLMTSLCEEAREKCALEIEQFCNEFYKAMEKINKEREKKLANIREAIEGLLPREREELLKSLTGTDDKGPEKFRK